MAKTLDTLLKELKEFEEKRQAYNQAMGIISYDAVTGAPAGGAERRGRTMGVLSEVVYKLDTGEETGAMLRDLTEQGDKLDFVTRRQVSELLRSYEKTKKIPMEEYVAYTVLLNKADAVWHEAKEKSDWAMFEPCMRDIVAFNRKYAAWIDPDKQPYDVLLDEFERGLTMGDCDTFFAVLRERLVPLIHRITEQGKQPDCAFLHREYPLELQRQLSDRMMDFIGIDRKYCSIRETEHPFTTNFGPKDVRITTHYHLNDPMSSLFSVIHEGGHALYELHIGENIADTSLGTGVSMGIHESQSRLFENLLGRSRAFTGALLPILRDLFPAQTAGAAEEDLYRAVNVAKPSLIRTEADELTYCLHIMLRYELEKLLIQENLDPAELPSLWREKVRDYLGLEVPDDRSGALQDSHWSGGAIGYFPSYALGSAYGAHMLKVMKRTVDVDAAVAAGDFKPIHAWLTERVWSKGCLYDPAEILTQTLGEPFDPTVYTDYLTEKYSALYGL
jgi:carboxypeptidase Taq